MCTIKEPTPNKDLTSDNIKKILINLGNLQGRKSEWIRSDLTVIKSNTISRIFWTLFAKHFNWSRKLFFSIDLEQSKNKLNAIRPAILGLNDENMEKIYNNAVAKFNLVASNYQVEPIMKKSLNNGPDALPMVSQEPIIIQNVVSDPKESLDEMTHRLFKLLADETEELIRDVETFPFLISEHRFTNILCPKHTAIVYIKQDLTSPEQSPSYIHANRIDTPKGKPFIAAQVNLQHDKFWKAAMLHTNLIIDLTSGREIEKYYPELNQTMEVNGLKIFCSKQEADGNNIVISTYTVSNEDGEVKEIKRIHYIAWVDFSATGAEDLIGLIKVADQHMEIGIPPIVHCRAGVGRTGTFITVYNVLHRIKEGTFEGEKTLKELILSGRVARGPVYVQSKAQLRLLLEITYQGN